MIKKRRRANLQFDLQLELYYRTLNRRQAVTWSGITLTMGSEELLFRPSDPLLEGDELEVTIHWPVLLNDTSRLNLVLRGSVTHCDASSCAVEIECHQFRTRASRPLGNRAVEPSRGAGSGRREEPVPRVASPYDQHAPARLAANSRTFA